MAGLKKALATPDAIVTVSGPVGVGKTTIVRRALDAIGKEQIVITVGRMQLGHDEVLELLLEELSVEMPSGTVQRFTTFRRLLKQYEDEGKRVFIAVEDVPRIGAEALSELEALTASDAGASEGANIVLMGNEGLNEALNTPKLARLKQRLRLKQTIAPLSSSELMGYFKHCFRLAGNEFDSIFEDGAAEVLHRLSGGIPRVANNLVESSLISAVDNKLDRVNVAQIKLVASEEYGLDIGRDSAPAAEPAPAPVVEPKPVARPDPLPEPRPEPVAEVAPPEPAAPVVEPPAPAPKPESEIPELIQDTLPDLEVLAPSLVSPEEPEQPAPSLESAQVEEPEDKVPDWERDPTLAQLRPDLDALEHAMAVAQGTTSDAEGDSDQNGKAEDPPEPVPEITLDRQIEAKVQKAEAALKEEEAKRAAAEAKAKEEEEKDSLIDNRPTSEILAEVRAKQAGQPIEDTSIEAQLAAPPPAETADTVDLNESTDTVADLPILQDMTSPAFEPAAHAEPEPEQIPELVAELEPVPQPEPVLKPEPVLQAEPELAPAPEPTPLPELALEPAPAPEPEPDPVPLPDPVEEEKARKADAELEQIAANLARAKTIDDCDDKMAETLFGEEFSMMAAEVAANAPPEFSANDEIEAPAEDVAAEEISLEEPVFEGAPDFEAAAAVNVQLETQPNGTSRSMDMSASQRLATVRALNATPGAAPPPNPSMPVASAEPPPPPSPAEQPESIEDQINTSMTQTLQTLSVRPPAEDDDDESKGGFFSRFKRS
jgi:type II secretory pathway predicted ATPase ExeA